MKSCTVIGQAVFSDRMRFHLSVTMLSLVMYEGVDRFYIGDGKTIDRMAAWAYRAVKKERADVAFTVVRSGMPGRRELMARGVQPAGFVLPQAEEAPWHRRDAVRDRWMVDMADVVIACVHVPVGRTYRLAQYARQMGKQVVSIGRLDVSAHAPTTDA